MSIDLTRLSRRVRLASICMLASGAPGALAADAHVQQQLQQREQQQMELRLKMQQQLDRSMQTPQGLQVPGVPRPPGIAALPGTQRGVAADITRGQLDRDQQQRLRQLHEQQSRSLITPPSSGVPGQMGLELGRQRALQSGSEELRHFEFQRRMDTDRDARTAP